MTRKNTDTARFLLDPADLPPLTDAQKAELEAPRAMPDSDIDYSDAPARNAGDGEAAEAGVAKAKPDNSHLAVMTAKKMRATSPANGTCRAVRGKL